MPGRCARQRPLLGGRRSGPSGREQLSFVGRELAGGERCHDLVEGQAALELAMHPSGLRLGVLGPARLTAASAAKQHHGGREHAEPRPPQHGRPAESQRLGELLRGDRCHAGTLSERPPALHLAFLIGSGDGLRNIHAL